LLQSTVGEGGVMAVGNTDWVLAEFVCTRCALPDRSQSRSVHGRIRMVLRWPCQPSTLAHKNVQQLLPVGQILSQALAPALAEDYVKCDATGLSELDNRHFEFLRSSTDTITSSLQARSRV